MKVHETRSQAHASAEEEKGVGKKHYKAENKAAHDAAEQGHKKGKAEKEEEPRAGASAEEEEKGGGKKHKAESKTHETEQVHKKAKAEKEKEKHNGNGKSAADIAKEFEEFCKATSEYLSIKQMREILEANDQDPVSDDAVVPRCQDMMFYGALEKCPICRGTLEFTGSNYVCTGVFSEWSSCIYSTREPTRSDQPIKLPDSIKNNSVFELIKNHQEQGDFPPRDLNPKDKPFFGMMISLSGRLSRTHHNWRTKIEENGGKVANSVHGATCLVVSPAERERGGSSKVVEAMERGVPVVREAWLSDSIQRHEAQPLQAYDVASDLSVGGKGIPWENQDPSEEALESISAEIKLYGKRGVYKDSRLQEQGGRIFEKDGILYNCAFSLCDGGRSLNDYCILQLIMVPDNKLHLYYKDNKLHLYYKRGRVGDDPRAEERQEEWQDVDAAVKEFTRLFEELTGNEFEPWEKEREFQKKSFKFYPVDMDDGVDVRHGGLGLQQQGVAVTHCKLEPLVANFIKVLCSQEIYRYAMMEMGLDSPDLPMGILSAFHLRKCEELLHNFISTINSKKEGEKNVVAVWSDFSQRWFTLLHSTRPLLFRDHQDIAEHAACALETVRDIRAASHLVGDLTGSTLDDPLFERYKKLGCSISPLDKDSSDYKMILKYLDKTYEPVKVGEISYGVSVDNIFAVEPSACPSYDEIKRLPNKVLLWCGTRSSNLMRHLKEGFLPAICSLPVAGYMFGRGIVCSDAAAEAARYGFTAVDRPEGFLVLAVASLGDQVTEFKNPPKETAPLEEKQLGVKGLGRKVPDENEHIVWKDDIKVPCGRLIPSQHRDSPLEYNEYCVYDPQKVSIRFLVGVKYEERHVEMDTAE